MDGHVAVVVAVSGHPAGTTMPSRLSSRSPCPPASRSTGTERAGRNVSQNYLVKYQYSGSRVNIALYTTSCSLVLAAMISYGFGTGTQRYGSCCAA
jgi:hypothetical protein